MPTLSHAMIPPPKGWDEFEDITLSALKARWQSPNLQRHGRSGQPQAGVDIYGEDDVGRLVGVQCKLVSDDLDFTVIKAEVDRAETFVPVLETFFVATTSKRDAKIQAEVRALTERRKRRSKFPVGVLFWDDLVQDLLRDPRAFHQHYPQIPLLDPLSGALLDGPRLQIELAMPDARRPAGRQITLLSKVLHEVPPIPPNEMIGSDLLWQVRRLEGLTAPLQYAMGTSGYLDPAEVEAYERAVALLQPICFWVKNSGKVRVDDVKIVLEIAKRPGLRAARELPDKPSPGMVVPRAWSLNQRIAPRVSVTETAHAWDVVLPIGKVHPDEAVTSKPFYLGAEQPCELSLTARVFGDNLAPSLSIPISVNVEVGEGWLGTFDPDE